MGACACTSLQRPRGEKQCNLIQSGENDTTNTISAHNSLHITHPFTTDLHCCDVTIYNYVSGWNRITNHKTVLKLYRDELMKQYCLLAFTFHANEILMNCVVTSKCIYSCENNSIQTLDMNDGTNRKYGWYGDIYDPNTQNFRKALIRIIDDLKTKDNWMLLSDLNKHSELTMRGYVRQNEIEYGLNVPPEITYMIWKYYQICGPEWQPIWNENKIDFIYLRHNSSKNRPTANSKVNIAYDGYLCQKNRRR
eukprot:1038050_1